MGLVGRHSLVLREGIHVVVCREHMEVCLAAPGQPTYLIHLHVGGSRMGEGGGGWRDGMMRAVSAA
jgi:hypothetical protein